MADLQASNRMDPSVQEGFTIATLIPVGSYAEEAFSQVIDYKHLSEYHKRYIDAKLSPGESDLIKRADCEDSEYESDRPSHPRHKSSQRIWAGHYLLSSERPGVVQPSVGWRIGRGATKLKNRGVDLLIVCPGEYTYEVGTVHALVQIHPKSGVLLLRGVRDEEPVIYESDNMKLKVELYEGDTYVLHHGVNSFSLGKLQFKLVYEQPDDAQYTKYIQIRNESLLEAGVDATTPHPCISAIPRKHHLRIDNFLLHDSISTGTFGYVHAAVDVRTGNPIAVKEIAIKNRNMVGDESLLHECSVSESFPNSRGLLQANCSKCDHGKPRPCGIVPEKFYIAYPLAMHDFSKQRWATTPLSTTLALLRGPLEGLKTLHEAGYMHRDISLRNVLVLSLKPPRAVLCDFGKAIPTTRHFDSRIGPIPTLAPEVNGVSLYDNKIDIWGIGYICCWILFPEFQRAHNKSRPDKAWHNIALGHLINYERSGGPLEQQFAELICRLLFWAPEKRPTAAQALQHPCMQYTELPPPLDAEGRRGKVRKTTDQKAEIASKAGKAEKRQIAAGNYSGDTEPLSSGIRPSHLEGPAQGG